MLQNAKISYEHIIGMHLLKLPEAPVDLLNRLNEKPELLGAGARIWDGYPNEFIVIEIGHITITMTNTDGLEIAVPAQYDQLDGTTYEPISHETCWMDFLPVVRRVMAIEQEA